MFRYHSEDNRKNSKYRKIQKKIMMAKVFEDILSDFAHLPKNNSDFIKSSTNKTNSSQDQTQEETGKLLLNRKNKKPVRLSPCSHLFKKIFIDIVNIVTESTKYQHPLRIQKTNSINDSICESRDSLSLQQKYFKKTIKSSLKETDLIIGDLCTAFPKIADELTRSTGNIINKKTLKQHINNAATSPHQIQTDNTEIIYKVFKYMSTITHELQLAQHLAKSAKTDFMKTQKNNRTASYSKTDDNKKPAQSKKEVLQQVIKFIKKNFEKHYSPVDFLEKLQKTCRTPGLSQLLKKYKTKSNQKIYDNYLKDIHATNDG